MSNSPFDNIENAKATEGGNWVRDGRYQVELGVIKMVTNRSKVEMLAIESTVTVVVDNNGGSGHRVGEEIVHFLKVANDSFLGNSKQFISASLGCHADAVGVEQANTVISDEQPLAGIVVEFTAQTIKTKANKDFTKVMYLGYITDGELIEPPLEAPAS